MSRKYTAQEMRYMVSGLETNLKYGMERVVIATPKLISMLRQAADMMERERKYEYAVRWTDGSVTCHSSNIECAREAESDINEYGLIICRAVRREVGEWEEIPNEEV